MSPAPTMSDGAERWRRLEEVCQAALERPAEERAAFLAQACGADEELRREAASLLEREARVHGFLETPLGELAANATYSPGEPRDFIGRRVGAYEIRARLGAGGMGEVYRAHDPHSAATWRSRCFPRPSPPIASASRVSSAKLACWRL